MLKNFRAFGHRTEPRILARRASPLVLLAMIGAATLSSQPAAADETGVSFWLPGLFGSLAAVPLQPGWSFSTTNYFTSVSAGKDVDFELGGRVVAGLDARVDLQYSTVAYAFPTPVLGGEAILSMSSIFANNDTSISGTLTGPHGNTISGSRSQTTTGFGDLYPVGQLRWNQGVNNYMTYLTGDIPVGDYSSQNIANIGIGHGAIDGGGGYTYLNPQTGNEFSAVLGVTYNFINPSTNVQSGIDSHLDWGASHFLTPNCLVRRGRLRLPADHRRQRVRQQTRSVHVARHRRWTASDFLVPRRGHAGRCQCQGYTEFDAQDRPSGYNLWLTFSITPEAPTTPKPITAKF